MIRTCKWDLMTIAVGHATGRRLCGAELFLLGLTVQKKMAGTNRKRQARAATLLIVQPAHTVPAPAVVVLGVKLAVMLSWCGYGNSRF